MPGVPSSSSETPAADERTPGPLPRDRGEPSATAPEHVRLALEELGATFVKLGQLLSTRSDLLPPVSTPTAEDHPGTSSQRKRGLGRRTVVFFLTLDEAGREFVAGGKEHVLAGAGSYSDR